METFLQLGHRFRPLTKKEKAEDFAEVHPHEKRRFVAKIKGGCLLYIPRCNEMIFFPTNLEDAPPQVWKEV